MPTPNRPLTVLVACESSGVVRDAFRAAGHDAWSVDIKPDASASPYHFQQSLHDWVDAYHQDLDDDLVNPIDLVIAHPPCVDLSVSGAQYWPAKQQDGRQQAAIDFFLYCYNIRALYTAVENPVGVMSTVFRKPDQYIQPYDYGHPESKKTGLWLRHLPPLTPTDTLTKPSCGYWANQTPSGQNKLGPSPTRSADRARTYSGIATAMVTQWPAYIYTNYTTPTRRIDL